MGHSIDRMRCRLALIVAMSLVAMAAALAPSGPAGAGGPFTVDTTADRPDARPGDGVCRTAAGRCSVRAALQEASVDNNRDVVWVPAGTYRLASEIVVATNLELVGAGRGATTITAPGTVLVLRGDTWAKFGSSYHLADLTLSGGGGVGSIGPCTLGLYDAAVSITDVTLTGGGHGVCSAPLWTGWLDGHRTWIVDNRLRGIDRMGRIVLTESRVEGNNIDGKATPADGGNGGGIYADDVTLLDTIVTGNRAAGLGGGIGTRSLTAASSTISSNQAPSGGGLAVGYPITGYLPDLASRFEIVNTTVTDNQAGGAGGAYLASGSLEPGSVIRQSTLALNSGGGLVADVSSGLTIEGSILADNDGIDCQTPGSVRITATNLLGDHLLGCSGPTDVLRGSAVLGPLANNGGPTPTRMPAPTSPTVDAVPTGDPICSPPHLSDQRHLPRPVDGNGDGDAACDLGAVERHPQLIQLPPIDLGFHECIHNGFVPFGLCQAPKLLDDIERHYDITLPAWMRDCWADGPGCGP